MWYLNSSFTKLNPPIKCHYIIAEEVIKFHQRVPGMNLQELEVVYNNNITPIDIYYVTGPGNIKFAYISKLLSPITFMPSRYGFKNFKQVLSN